MAAIDDVIAEREHQKTRWSVEHDDEHDDYSLALAAVCYATPVLLYVRHDLANAVQFRDPWPASWDDGHDKRYRIGERVGNPGNYVADPATYLPAERRELLVKAAAMLVAEIERMDRRQERAQRGLAAIADS
jgi:hypothetical protein